MHVLTADTTAPNAFWLNRNFDINPPGCSPQPLPSISPPPPPPRRADNGSDAESSAARRRGSPQGPPLPPSSLPLLPCTPGVAPVDGSDGSAAASAAAAVTVVVVAVEEKARAGEGGGGGAGGAHPRTNARISASWCPHLTPRLSVSSRALRANSEPGAQRRTGLVVAVPLLSPSVAAALEVAAAGVGTG